MKNIKVSVIQNFFVSKFFCNLYCTWLRLPNFLCFRICKSDMVLLFVCFRISLVFLLSVERKTVSVFELSQQLRKEVSPETACDERLQRQGATLQMSLLHVHIAISFWYLQARETLARESGRLRYRCIRHD